MVKVSFVWLGLLYKAGNPDQDHRAYKRNNDRADYAASGPNTNQPENPSADDAAEQSEEDVHEHTVATTLHYLAGQPAGDQAGHNPSQKALRNFLLGSEGSDDAVLSGE